MPENYNIGGNMRVDVIKAMNDIVDMYWHEEQRDWEELENPDDHIFHAFNTIKNYIKNKDRMNRDLALNELYEKLGYKRKRSI